MVTGTFNLNDPINAEHSADVMRRTGAFVRRDPKLADAIFGNQAALDNLTAPPGSAEDTPFELPKQYIDSGTLCGLWLGLALYYGTHGRPCSADHRVGVRLFTNATIKEHAEYITPMLPLMTREIPQPLSNSVPARFAWAYAIDPQRKTAIYLAEIAGCVFWVIGIHAGEFDEERMPWANWFYRNDGRWLGPYELLY